MQAAFAGLLGPTRGAIAAYAAPRRHRRLRSYEDAACLPVSASLPAV